MRQLSQTSRSCMASSLGTWRQLPPLPVRPPRTQRRHWHCQECSAAPMAAAKGFATSVPVAPAPVAAAKGFAVPVPASSAPTGSPVVVLPPAPDLKGKGVRANWNATALAFLGDSVWELYVRRHYFFPPSKLTRYYEGVASQVRAETQESYYEMLRAGDFMSAEEVEVLAWGRNARVNVPPRFKNSGSHSVSYKRATAIECLVGYLYLTDAARLHELMLYLGISGDNSAGRVAITL